MCLLLTLLEPVVANQKEKIGRIFGILTLASLGVTNETSLSSEGTRGNLAFGPCAPSKHDAEVSCAIPASLSPKTHRPYHPTGGVPPAHPLNLTRYLVHSPKITLMKTLHCHQCFVSTNRCQPPIARTSMAKKAKTNFTNRSPKTKTLLVPYYS